MSVPLYTDEHVRHQLRVSVGVCIRDLELLAKACRLEEFQSQVLYLPIK